MRDMFRFPKQQQLKKIRNRNFGLKYKKKRNFQTSTSCLMKEALQDGTLMKNMQGQIPLPSFTVITFIAQDTRLFSYG